MADDSKDLVAALAAPVINSKGLHYNYTRYPLSIKLPESLKCGSKIYVHGAASPFGFRFSINLTDAEKDGNTIFHFNPRFDEKCVVRNTYLNGAWGINGERHGGFPFVAGEPFLICITANVYGYEVEINGALFTAYKHRMPLQCVTHINIIAEVTVYGIHIIPPYMPEDGNKDDEIDHIDFDIISFNDVLSNPVIVAENSNEHIDDADNKSTSQTSNAKLECSPSKTLNSSSFRGNKRIRSDVPEFIERTGKPLVISMQRQEVTDEFFHFSQNIAYQLRQLPLADALECQFEIMNIVQKTRLSLLNKKMPYPVPPGPPEAANNVRFTTNSSFPSNSSSSHSSKLYEDVI